MWTLYLVMISVGMGQTIVFAIIPMLGRELALHELVFTVPGFGQYAPKELAITAMSAMTALIFFLVTPFWGRRSDLVGRKAVILTGLLGYTFGTLLFNGASYIGLAGLLSGWGLYFLMVLSRALHALVMSAATPASTAYVVDVTSAENRTKGVSKLSAAIQFGSMLGPTLAIFAAYSFLTPLFIQAAITLFAALMVYRYLPDTDNHRRTEEAPQARLGYFDKRFRIFIFISCLMYTLLGTVQQTLGFYFQDRLHLSGVEAAQYYSAAMMVSSASMLFTQVLVVQRFSWQPLNLLRLGLPFCLLGYLVLANAQDLLLLMFGMSCYGIGMGLSGPGCTASATFLVEPREQGALAGLLAASAGLGFVIGPVAGGFVYGFNPAFPYWVAAMVLVPLIVFLLLMKTPAPLSAKFKD
jgi:MFS family permease